jgi:hypothetical protein
LLVLSIELAGADGALRPLSSETSARVDAVATDILVVK